MKRTVGAFGSLLLHLALILSLLVSTARSDAPPGHLQPGDIKLIDEKQKLREAQMPMLTPPVKMAAVGPPAAIAPPCLGDSYHGIGIMGFGGEIMSVGEGTPASRAGLTVADSIDNSEILGRNLHPDGTVLTLIVRRDGVLRTVVVTTAEICEDD